MREPRHAVCWGLPRKHPLSGGVASGTTHTLTHMCLADLSQLADSVIEPELHRVYPYLVCIAFGGIFVLLGLRVLLIVRWRLPFPSGTASGSMINSLHDAHRAAPRGAAAAAAADGDAEELQTALDAQQPHATGATYLDLLPDSVGVGGTSPVQDSYAGDESDSRGSDPGGGQSPEQLAARKVKVLAYTALGSFLFDVFKW